MYDIIVYALTYQQKNKRIRVSIVLPVYNEADHIGACLQAIAAQTAAPYEVIVVDNNSSDETAAIAASFPFVKVLHETKQGVVYARNTGFNAARGEIIGRIDADTRLPSNWVRQVKRIFSDKTLGAASGSMSYYDMPAQRTVARIDLAFRRRAARRLKDEVFLQAANMAIRRSAWRKMRSQLCNRGGMHEDFDLAIHLQAAGLRVEFRPELKAMVSARCLDDSWRSFFTYVRLNPGTYALHGLKSRRHFYPLVTLLLLLYLPLRLLYRAYDSQNGQFVWREAFRSSMKRINPATFAD